MHTDISLTCRKFKSFRSVAQDRIWGRAFSENFSEWAFNMEPAYAASPRTRVPSLAVYRVIRERRCRLQKNNNYAYEFQFSLKGKLAHDCVSENGTLSAEGAVFRDRLVEHMNQRLGGEIIASGWRDGGEAIEFYFLSIPITEENRLAGARIFHEKRQSEMMGKLVLDPILEAYSLCRQSGYYSREYDEVSRVEGLLSQPVLSVPLLPVPEDINSHEDAKAYRRGAVERQRLRVEAHQAKAAYRNLLVLQYKSAALNHGLLQQSDFRHHLLMDGTKEIASRMARMMFRAFNSELLQHIETPERRQLLAGAIMELVIDKLYMDAGGED